MTRTAVYRHYDAAGALLYVGMSANPTRRLSEHNSRSGHADQVARIDVQWFDTREEAAAVEVAAIRDAVPRANRAAKPWTPKANGVCAHPDLIAEIATFCEATGMSKAAFGKAALGDPAFVYDLEGGRQCLPRTVAKARGYINGYAAEGAA